MPLSFVSDSKIFSNSLKSMLTQEARDHSIITISLNCALRLSELASLDIDQVDNEIISVVGKGNKEHRIYLTPATKKID